MQGLLTSHPNPQRPEHFRAFFLVAAALLVLPWVHLWAPSPQSNTMPLLVSWACLCVLAVGGQFPSPKLVAQTWAWAALISSAMGIVQYFGWASAWGGWIHVPAYLGDAVGNLRQRNQLATLTSIGLVAVLWWQTLGLRNRHTAWMLALLALGNAATGSRTGLLEILLILLLCVAWSFQKHPSGQRRLSWRWGLWALGIYLLASQLLPMALVQVSGQGVANAVARMGQLEGCGTRTALWGNVVHLIGLKPWWGWGWDELKYAHYITAYPGTRFCDILSNAHNLPLHLAFAWGIPAAIGIVGVMLTSILWMRPWRIVQPAHTLAWGVLAVIGLHSLLEYPLWYGPFQIATLLSLCMLWSGQTHMPARRAHTLQALGGAGLVLIALISADYWRMRQIYLPAAERSVVWRHDPWGHAQNTLFFERSVTFAKLTTTEVTADNAAWMLDTSQAMLHYSPEPRVIQRLIDSARLLGRDDLVALHQQRLRQAFKTPGQ